MGVGSVAISIAAGGSAFQFYSSGVLSNCNDFVMDHTVQLVGYGTDSASGKDYWLVRNSWGNWGEKGYLRLQRYGEGKEPCGVDKKPQDGMLARGTLPRAPTVVNVACYRRHRTRPISRMSHHLPPRLLQHHQHLQHRQLLFHRQLLLDASTLKMTAIVLTWSNRLV